jgi:hypothetical protein
MALSVIVLDGAVRSHDCACAAAAVDATAAATAAVTVAAAPSALLLDLFLCTVTMANAAAASWAACIKELQKLVDDPSTSPDTAQRAVDKLDQDIAAPLPNAAWKKLVRDVKVMPSRCTLI